MKIAILLKKIARTSLTVIQKSVSYNRFQKYSLPGGSMMKYKYSFFAIFLLVVILFYSIADATKKIYSWDLSHSTL